MVVLDRLRVPDSQPDCKDKGRVVTKSDIEYDKMARVWPGPEQHRGIDVDGGRSPDFSDPKGRRDQPRDQFPPVNQRFLLCDVIGHTRRNCADFDEALRKNMVYLWNGRVHASDMRTMLEVNTRRGGMKRVMEEVAAPHVEAIHFHRCGRRKGHQRRHKPRVLAGGTGDLLGKEAKEGRKRPRRKASTR